MAHCGKCGGSIDLRFFRDSYIHPRKGPCHRICPARAKQPKRRTYQLQRPAKLGWQAARRYAIKGTCEVTFADLWIAEGQSARYVGIIDHIVPERYCKAAKINPHATVNLICISPSVHGRKRAAEDRFLKAGDVLTFWDELNKQNWPMDRVAAAMKYAGLRVPGETQ